MISLLYEKNSFYPPAHLRPACHQIARGLQSLMLATVSVRKTLTQPQIERRAWIRSADTDLITEMARKAGNYCWS